MRRDSLPNAVANVPSRAILAKPSMPYHRVPINQAERGNDPYHATRCRTNKIHPFDSLSFMNITFSCPACGHDVRSSVRPTDRLLDCPRCAAAISLPPDAFEGEQLRRCLVCPSTDLFVRKDFPQRLGVAIVALGILGSSIAWGYSLVIATFAILFATALVDVILYLVVPDALMCYRCGAQYRLAPGMARHGAFSLETHERHRQQSARMAGQRR
jgi:hypothetical protein